MIKEHYREMKVLGKYYKIDEEKKIVTIPFRFEKVSDIIDSTYDGEDNFIIREDVVAEIEKKVVRIPIMYKVNVDIQIDDYEGIEPTKLHENINDLLELNHYNLGREKRVNRLIAIILLIVGISIISINVTAKNGGWYQDIAYEILDIVSWVFIWEATTIAFLTTSELDINANKLIMRINCLSLLDKDKNVLISKKAKDETVEWAENARIDKIARYMLLFSGAILIISTIMSIISEISLVVILFDINEETGLTNLDSVGGPLFYSIMTGISLLVYFVTLSSGISALSSYRGRGPFRKRFSYVLMVLMGFTFIIELASLIFSYKKETFVTTILMLLATLFFVAGKIITIVINKKEARMIRE